MAYAKKQTRKILTYDRGRRAEWWAAMLLRLKGYKILMQRYKTSVGEIDIVAQRGQVLAFIEVKARCSDKEALESLTYTMRRRIERAAMFFITECEKDFGDCDPEMRFDLITVSPFSFSQPFFIRHLDNAWCLDA